MVELIASNNMTVVVGLGVTGLSVARHLARQELPFVVTDTRIDPPCLTALSEVLPHAAVEIGGLNAETLCAAKLIVVSPGLSLAHPVLRQAIDSGVTVTGDIQLFVDAAKVPIIAITGSNGKSTVTTLLGAMANAQGRSVGIGGNLGVPALNLLDDSRDLYVLELSSFQLELVDSLNADVATVLNISADHMDRYVDMAQYHRAKHRIFSGVKQVVINRQDALSHPLVAPGVKSWSFGLDKPDFDGFGVISLDGQAYLAFEKQALLPVSALILKEPHNIANILAALALGHAAGLSMDGMVETAKSFTGLSHRCQFVARKGGADWINDSKATNVGATVAAINGLSANNKNIVLIAGGQSKGQSFEALAEAASEAVRLVIVFGEDGNLLADLLGEVADVVYATSLLAAVNTAAAAVKVGDKVLLSPACASFDMFSGFEDRGQQFVTAVEALA